MQSVETPQPGTPGLSVADGPSMAGPVCVWIGSVVFCVEYVGRVWPSGYDSLVIPAGLAIASVSAIRHRAWRPVVWALAGLVPPIIVLAIFGFSSWG